MRVELAKALDNDGRNARFLHDAKHCPPWQGGEALRHVELHEPEGTAAAALKFNGVSDQLGQVQRTGLGPKPHHRGAEIYTLEGRCPALCDSLGPEAVDHVQHRDGALVLWAGTPGGLRDHGDVGLQQLVGPGPLRLHRGEQVGDPAEEDVRERLPHSQGDAANPRRGALTHAAKRGPDPRQSPGFMRPRAPWNVREVPGSPEGSPTGGGVHRFVHPPNPADPVGPHGFVHGIVGAALLARGVQYRGSTPLGRIAV